MRRYAAWTVVLVLAAVATNARSEEGEPSPQAVHKAIQSGASWLKAQHATGFEGETWHDTGELCVLTLHHAGTMSNNRSPFRFPPLYSADSIIWRWNDRRVKWKTLP